MFNIAEYLKKFAHMEGDSLLQKQAISSTLEEVCGIKDAKFDVKKGVVVVNAPSAAKSVIFTRKKMILETINAKYSGKKVIDIR